MRSIFTKATAAVTGVALALTLGLAGCGGSQPTSEEAATAEKTETTAEKTDATPDKAEAGTEAEVGSTLIIINTEGMGMITFTQDGEESVQANSAGTHVNDGDKLTLNAYPSDGSEFVKWTKDGEDFSTEATVEITADGNAEYVAVFDYV